jgi:hypothetical protein
MRYMPDGLPSLKTYEQAKAYAESIRPYIKGRAKGSIPLGSVRRYDRSIIRVRPDSIGLFYYSNEVIRFYPDGRKVLSHCGWPSNSTASFLGDVLGHSKFKQAAGKIYYADSNYKLYKLTNHLRETPLILDADNNPTSYEVESKYVLNREAFKIIKLRYEPFVRFVRDILTLNQNVTNEFESKSAGRKFNSHEKTLAVDVKTVAFSRNHKNTQHSVRDEFFESVSDALKLNDVSLTLQAFYPLAFQLATSAAQARWDREAIRYEYTCTPQQAKEFFYKLLKYEFANSIFIKEEIQPTTTAVYDNNAKYVELQYA